MNAPSIHSSGRKETCSIDMEFARELERSARDIALRVVALPLARSGLSIDYLFDYAASNGIRNLFVLDQKVIGIEDRGELRAYGYVLHGLHGTVTVIDHHVSEPRLRAVSTGNLALEYLRCHTDGPPQDAVIAITHGDCDSVISAGLMLRVLPPLEAFGEAALAADHSFEANQIADLLQAIEGFPQAGGVMARTDQERSDPLAPSIEQSVRNLGLLLQGKPLELHVARALQGRVTTRETWRMRISRGEVVSFPHGTALIVLQGKPAQDPYPEFLKPLLPDASAILVFHQVPEGDDFQQVRALAGEAFPTGVSFSDSSLISEVMVPGFGGRHDAGSNRRGGISFKGDPRYVAQTVDDRIGAARARLSGSIHLKSAGNFVIPALGFGCSGLGARKDGSHSKRDPSNDDGKDIERVTMALKHGFRHFDMAEVYAEGHCERIVGEALRASTVSRGDLILATKVLPQNLKCTDLIAAVEGSLSRVGVEYLDVVYLHSPNPEIDVRDTADALRILVDAGKIRAVGASNHSVASLETIRCALGKKTPYDVRIVQAHYSLRFREPETSGLLEYCQREGLILCAWRPLERGSLQGEIGAAAVDACVAYDLEPAVLSLSWLLSQPSVVAVTSASSEAHLRAGVRAATVSLLPEELELLRTSFPGQLARDVRYPLR